MNEKTGAEIRKEIREAVDSACRAFARLGRAIQRIVSEVDWEAIVKACDECDEESDESEESDEKESLKTLADFVREASEHLGWPPETIESELSKVAAYGTYYTRDKAAFEYVFARVNLATITGETESNWEAHTRQPHGDEAGEPEYIIREFCRD